MLPSGRSTRWTFQVGMKKRRGQRLSSTSQRPGLDQWDPESHS